MRRMIACMLDRLMMSIRGLLAVAFGLAVSLNFVNVIGRYVLGRSLLVADEIQVYIMVAMSFLGAAVVSWRGEHLRMDVIARALPGGARAALRAAEVVLVIVLAGFVAVQSTHYAAQMYALDRTSDNAGIPLWIPHGTVALGFGLIALIALIALWRGFENFRRGRSRNDGVRKDSGA